MFRKLLASTVKTVRSARSLSIYSGRGDLDDLGRLDYIIEVPTTKPLGSPAVDLKKFRMIDLIDPLTGKLKSNSNQQLTKLFKQGQKEAEEAIVPPIAPTLTLTGK